MKMATTKQAIPCDTPSHNTLNLSFYWIHIVSEKHYYHSLMNNKIDT